jgi:hypothetical protein
VLVFSPSLVSIVYLHRAREHAGKMLRCELAFFLAASKRAFEKKASKVTGQDDKKKLLRTKKKKKE